MDMRNNRSCTSATARGLGCRQSYRTPCTATRTSGNGCGCAQSNRSVADSCERRQSTRNVTGGCGCEGQRRTTSGSCGCRQKGCDSLMTKLQQLDFAIQETVLYLDGYPDDCQALQYLRRLCEERTAVAKEYEASCGPLTAAGNCSSDKWQWATSPWPWHVEFPGNKNS